MYLIKKYSQLSASDKILLFEASIILIIIKLLIRLLPIRFYKKIFGKQNSEPEIQVSENQSHTLYKISQAIVRSRKVIPWKSKCLTEAIAAKIMLRKRGIASTLFLGINKDEDKMIAHAWLRCGNTYITGRRGMNKFVVLSSFT